MRWQIGVNLGIGSLRLSALGIGSLRLIDLGICSLRRSSLWWRALIIDTLRHLTVSYVWRRHIVLMLNEMVVVVGHSPSLIPFSYNSDDGATENEASNDDNHD